MVQTPPFCSLANRLYYCTILSIVSPGGDGCICGLCTSSLVAFAGRWLNKTFFYMSSNA